MKVPWPPTEGSERLLREDVNCNGAGELQRAVTTHMRSLCLLLEDRAWSHDHLEINGQQHQWLSILTCHT